MGETSLLTDSNLWETIIDYAYDGIFVTDASGIVLYCNAAFLRLSGLTRDKIIGRSMPALIAAGEIPDACSPEVISSGQPVTKMIEYYRGVATLVTSMPVWNEHHQLVQVISNIRDISELAKLREQLRKSSALNEEYQNQLRQMQGTTPFIVVSAAMENVLRLALRVAHVNSPVLIQGESGVGKDMLARYIHDAGDPSGNSPFVQINCSAIPETLLESELFGYEPGAFTGASKKGKAGLFELANHGTLFLDEIGEMPMPLQVKLLDVLQTNKIFRLGGIKAIDINARIIAATNCNLEQAVAENRFRRDLYYRLNVIPITIPPLRERKDDLVPLIMHFVEKKNRKYNLTRRIKPQAVEMLAEYGWPGNVRELRNVIERMVVMAEDDDIDERYVPNYIKQLVGKKIFINTPDYFDTFDLKTIIGELEREVIRRALEVFGTMRLAAAQLGIDLSTLVRKKKKYGL